MLKTEPTWLTWTSSIVRCPSDMAFIMFSGQLFCWFYCYMLITVTLKLFLFSLFWAAFSSCLLLLHLSLVELGATNCEKKKSGKLCFISRTSVWSNKMYWTSLISHYNAFFFFSLSKSILDVFVYSFQFVLSILKYRHQKQAYHSINSLPLSSWKIGLEQWKAWNTPSYPPESPPAWLPCGLSLGQTEDCLWATRQW